MDDRARHSNRYSTLYRRTEMSLMLAKRTNIYISPHFESPPHSRARPAYSPIVHAGGILHPHCRSQGGCNDYAEEDSQHVFKYLIPSCQLTTVHLRHSRFVLPLQIELGRDLPSGLYNATQYHGIILMLWKHTTSLLRRFLSKSGASKTPHTRTIHFTAPGTP